jgi:hypothetical protein
MWMVAFRRSGSAAKALLKAIRGANRSYGIRP